ncbi:putative ATP-dependent RNA helicase DHX33 [Acanthaster planci]|uniref:RNA helicase n=1 Tax=Acanthaster planci TaxID=133434 RepID=A0A8B7Z1D0_ACAPL|nr:putative ATP-dependent RNA helicase DHX33 [Acanthaster planci]XP_022098583.1 putative ATP-dependent RNA helicase DHX33 [Acanthaster planci]XP_022098584.1 putative ATP-dependent RNA helicase DHX33 [Acanthaster planci]XP_022098585.1 putative ATP-dependent RNA helicase DHX33 [Acanthaster planci]
MNSETPKRRKFSQDSGVEQLQDLYQHRCSLPIYPARGKLMRELQKNASSIVIGETGSGKTTQIPQYLVEGNVCKGGMVACTQPRRVAAISIATRVAKEMNANLGEEVGYCVRFDDTTSAKTKIKYMTDGMLLREAILDPKLSRYSIVILDEAHERTVHTDVLFGVVKKAQKQRSGNDARTLKVIVMSATMDVDHFSLYFNNAPVLYLQGRQHPIQLLYSSESQTDYLFAAMVAIFQIHQKQPASEDMLVFLTGQEEIETLVRSIKEVARDLPSDCPGLVVTPMYAALPSHLQLKVFQPTPPGKRKIILSTNIAETSVTIPGIKHVIDTGKVKAKSYQPGSGLDMLKVQWVSQAQAWQRTGRAGREDSGTCWRLYTESEFSRLPVNTIPEIQRCNLANVVLQLLALNICDVLTFDFMDPPSKESLHSALEQLQLLGAVDKENNQQLMPIGREMSVFPLEPRLARVILASKQHGCLEEILTIVSLLSVESIQHSPQNKREAALAAWRKFQSSEGDHLTLLTMYRAYKAVKGNKEWCFENFVHQRNMRHAMEIRAQLRDLCVKAGLPIMSCGQDTTPVRKCLVQGLFMNSAELQRDGTYFTLDRKQTVSIHPSSCLFQCKPAYLLYGELVQTTKCYMRNVCVIDPQWLYDVAPDYFRQRVARNR